MSLEKTELLDAVNRRILQALNADPRASMSAIGREVGLSAPSVTERVQRLERAGVIRGYRVDIDPAALGLGVTAYTRIRPAAGRLDKVVALARSLPHVTECHRITGEDCFLLRVHAARIEDLEETLDLFLVHGQTITSIVVTSPIEWRPLPLETSQAETS